MFCARFPQLMTHITPQLLTHVRQPWGVGAAAAMTRPPLLHRHRITPPWPTPHLPLFDDVTTEMVQSSESCYGDREPINNSCSGGF